MKKWLQKMLGIVTLAQGFMKAVKRIEKTERRLTRIENNLGLVKKSKRYGEIERARSERRHPARHH